MKYKDLVPEIRKFINVVRENNRIGMEHFHTNEKELYEAFDGDLVDENTINEDEAINEWSLTNFFNGGDKDDDPMYDENGNVVGTVGDFNKKFDEEIKQNELRQKQEYLKSKETENQRANEYKQSLEQLLTNKNNHQSNQSDSNIKGPVAGPNGPANNGGSQTPPAQNTPAPANDANKKEEELAKQMEKQDNAQKPAAQQQQPQQNNQQNNNNSGDEYYNMVYGANGQPVGKQGDNNAQASDAPKPPSKPNRNYTPEEQKMYDKMYNQYLQQEMLKKENQNKAKELELRKQGQKLDNSITATNAQQNQNQNQQQNTKDNGSNEGGAKRLIDSGWLKSIRNTGMWKSLSNSRLGNWLKNTSLWKNVSNIYKGGQQQANNPQGDTPTLTPPAQNTPAPANDANKKEEELAKQMEKQDNAAEPANNGKPAAAPAPNAQKPANNNGDKEYNMIYGANGQPVGNQSNNTTAQQPTTTPPTQNDIGAAEKPNNEPPKEGEKDKEEDIANQMAQMSGANGPQK